MRDKILVNTRHSLCQKQNPVERPAETIDAISLLRPIFWQKTAKHFDNPQLLAQKSLLQAACPPRYLCRFLQQRLGIYNSRAIICFTHRMASAASSAILKRLALRLRGLSPKLFRRSITNCLEFDPGLTLITTQGGKPVCG